MRPAPSVRQYTDRSGFSSAYPRQCPTRPRTIARMESQKTDHRPVWPPPSKSELREAKLIDGVVWNAKDPKAYADGFKVKG